MPWAVLPCTISSSIKIAPPVPTPCTASSIHRGMSAAAVFNLRPNLNTGKSHKAFHNATSARCTLHQDKWPSFCTHTHTHTDTPLVCVGMCVYDICIKYKHYYLCFAIDSCQSIFVACPDDVDIVALLLLPNCPCRHSRTRCYIE